MATVNALLNVTTNSFDMFDYRWHLAATAGAVTVAAAIAAAITSIRDRLKEVRAEDLLAPASGSNWTIPRPDAGLVARPELASQLLERLTQAEAGTVAMSGLNGAGGFGKTALAKLVCSDPAVRSRFREGAWVTIGEHVEGAALAERILDVHYQLTGERPALTDPEQAGLRLGAELDRRPSVLLVIDDVWRPEQLRPFLNGGTNSCMRLVTTRRSSVLPAPAQRTAILVDELSYDQARTLLTGGQSIPPEQEMTELIALTGRWPLLLSLAHRHLANNIKRGATPSDAVAGLVERLRADGPTSLDLGDQSSRDQAVAASIAASMDLLTESQKDRYMELGIFAEDIDIPRDMLAILWAETGGLARTETDRLCDALADLSLVTDPTNKRLRLHDVIRAYLRQKSGNRLPAIHTALVAAARLLLSEINTETPTPWWQLPDQPDYLWSHLAQHLAEAGQTDELNGLATDLRWIEAQIRHAGITSVDSDLALLADPTAVVLRRVLQQNAHLFTPIEPETAIADTLMSRLAAIEDLQEFVERYDASRTPGSHLTAAWPPPDRPHPALRRAMSGHTDAVTGFAIAPGGSWLVTTSWNDTARIWDTATGELWHTLYGHTDRVSCCAIATDGSWLVTACADGTAHIWDSASGTVRQDLIGHIDWVVGCAIAPDGSWLVTASDDGTARIWDPAFGTLRHILRGHADRVTSCAIAPDGSWLATTSDDGTARIWDPVLGSVRHVLRGHTNRVTKCAISPDGSWLATASWDSTVRVWDASGTLRHVLHGHTDRVTECAITRDGSWLATASWDSTVRVWDAKSGAVRHILRGHTNRVTSCTITPDGSWLATASDDGTARIWQPELGVVKHVLRGHTNRVTGCAVAPDGSWLATTSYDRTNRIWDTASGNVRHAMYGHTEWVIRCAVAPDGSWLATTCDDGTVRIRDTETGTVRDVLRGHTDRATGCAIAPDGTWLATTSNDGTARIWNPQAGTINYTLRGHTDRVTGCAIAPDGTWLATTSNY
ncbi:NB-ARC domain-containing protein, partial [Micromonospora sp. NPDC003241]